VRERGGGGKFKNRGKGWGSFWTRGQVVFTGPQREEQTKKRTYGKLSKKWGGLGVQKAPKNDVRSIIRRRKGGGKDRNNKRTLPRGSAGSQISQKSICNCAKEGGRIGVFWKKNFPPKQKKRG